MSVSQTLPRVTVLLALTATVSLVLAVPAGAAPLGAHLLVVPAGSIFSSIGGALLGAFSWTVGLASKFVLVTLSALIKMLIPRSWAHAPLALFEWIVAVPNYAGTITTPGGSTSFGFAGVNAIRELFEWIGIGVLPLSLTYATGRSMIGAGDHIAAPIVRVIGLAAVLLSYGWWWGQAAAVVNQLSQLILAPGVVTDGMRQLMAYAVEGTVLGGWQLIDLGLMAALALELLALIVVKVVIVLVGAIVFATGPVTIGLVPIEAGATLARAWASAAATVLIVPVVWAAIIAVGSVLIGDATTAGPLVGGNSTVGQLLGGVIVAVAGAATLWLCLKASREAAHVLRAQVGGAVASAGRARSSRTTPAQVSTGGAVRDPQALRGFQGQIRQAARTTNRPTTGGGGRIASTPGTGGIGKSVAGGRVGRGVTVAGGAIRAGARTAGRTLTRVTREASGDPAANRPATADRRGRSSARGRATTAQRATGKAHRRSTARAATSSRQPDVAREGKRPASATPATAPKKQPSTRGPQGSTVKAAPRTASPTGARAVSKQGSSQNANRNGAADSKRARAAGAARRDAATQAPASAGRLDSPRTRPTSPSSRPQPVGGSPGRSRTQNSPKPTRPAPSDSQRQVSAAPSPTAKGRSTSQAGRRSSTTERPQTTQSRVESPRASRSWRLRLGRRAD